jgi:hypothetical protein
MAKAVAIFTGGTHALTQAAVRKDGVVFSRHQEETPFGRRWTSWAATGEHLGHNEQAGINELSAGFATLRRARADDNLINNRALFNAKGEIRARLPQH